MKVACVIPAYNEEPNIGHVVKGAKKYCDLVIVVDDGSTDRTSLEAKREGAIVIRHQRNLGKGAALRTGFKSAIEHGADVIVVIDGDGQHDPNEIPKLVQALLNRDADIVIGSRFLKRQLSGMPPQRILSNFLTTTILKLLFGIKITDSQCGFRAFKRTALEKLIDFEDNKYAAETEILINAKRYGFKIIEVGISVKYGEEESKIRPIRDTVRWIRLVFKKFFEKQ
ncbi:MAG: glycosyltransferase family 2 protein [Candidatus Baldrarchaeia archaeon]